MKPRLGRKVYCLYNDGILVDTVGYLGKNSFILSSFGDAVEDDSLEWDYDDYNVQWFTSLSKAKQALLEKYSRVAKPKQKIVKVSDRWYEFREVE